MVASRNGRLAVVCLLLSKGADPNSRDSTRTALSLAAAHDHLEVCLLLISHAADLLEIVRDGQTALDLCDSYLCLTPEVNQRLALLRKAYDEGPHPNARWVRRWPFVCVLVCCDFQPLAARKAYLLMINPPLPAGCCDSPSANRHPRAVPRVPARHSVLPPRLLEADRELPVSHQVCGMSKSISSESV